MRDFLKELGKLISNTAVYSNVHEDVRNEFDEVNFKKYPLGDTSRR